jgi:MinD superfamily P-loop ATPase
MRIVVASGKGGTGKTTIATSLALALTDRPVLLLDCDVEAPNAHLVLSPQLTVREDVSQLIPSVIEARCTGCGRCAEVCRFHAIAVLRGRVLVFPELCHSCGSCVSNCPEAALDEQPKVIGVLEAGLVPNGPAFARGVLNVGEPMAGPLIRRLKSWVFPRQVAAGPAADLVEILDAPPGTSCPVVETLRGGDFALLVSEPTPFGLHDLRLVVEVVRELALPAGVIINRDMPNNGDLERFCRELDLPILMRIPLDRGIGSALASGQSLVAVRPEYGEALRGVFAHIQQTVVEGVP